VGAKITGAIAAIAVSSASASVVGLAYTGLVAVRFDSTGVFGLVDGAERAPPETGVVLDATKGPFTSLPDLPADGDGPRCQDVTGSGGCILVAPAPELKLTFFGYTVSLPMDWYGFDRGDDAYRAPQEQQFLELFSERQQTPEHGVQNSDGQTGVQNAPQTDEVPYSSASDNSPALMSTPFTYSIVVGDAPIGKLQTPAMPNGGPNPTEALGSPFASMSSGSVASIPEPSTWAMMLAGLAGLGFAGLRRARAPRPPERRRAS
jgi:PEP-CTERM motif